MIYPGQNLASPVNPATQQAANATTQAGIAQMEDATRNRAIGSQERIAQMRQQGFREQRAFDAAQQQEALNFQREQKARDRETEERLARESMQLSRAQFNAEMEYLTATTEGKLAALDKVRGIESELDSLTADMIAAKASAGKTDEQIAENLTVAAGRFEEMGNMKAQLEENATRAANEVVAGIDRQIRDELSNVRREYAEGARGTFQGQAGLAEGVPASFVAAYVTGNDPMARMIEDQGGTADRGLIESALLAGMQIRGTAGLVGEQILQSILDGVLGEEGSVDLGQAAEIRATLDRVTSPEGSRNIVARSLATQIVNSTSSTQSGSGLADQTDVLASVIEGISSGELDEGEARSRIAAAELDPEMVGTFLHVFGTVARPAAFSETAASSSLTDREVSAGPDVIREGSNRFRMFGSRLRGLSSERLFAVRDRINANRGDLTTAFFAGLEEDDLFGMADGALSDARTSFGEARELQDELAEMLARETQLERSLSRAGRAETLEAELDALRRRAATMNTTFEELLR